MSETESQHEDELEESDAPQKKPRISDGTEDYE